MKIVYIICRIQKSCTCHDPDCPGTISDYEHEDHGWTEAISRAKQHETRESANESIKKHCINEAEAETYYNIQPFYKP